MDINTLDLFQLYPIDPEGRLFISPEVNDWQPLADAGITAVIDLDCKLDTSVPNMPNSVLYVFWPIDDRPELPDERLLTTMGQLGASLLAQGHKVVCQCGMGQNRSALVAGMILLHCGLSGLEAVALIRAHREGALWNKTFRNYLLSRGPLREAGSLHSLALKAA